MNLKLLFTGICLCSISYLSYGQSQNQASSEPTPAVVSSHSHLMAQRTKLDAKQTEINQATMTSRAQFNQLNDEFRTLKEAYVRLLSTELEKTADTASRTQLQEEITRYSETHLQTR